MDLGGKQGGQGGQPDWARGYGDPALDPWEAPAIIDEPRRTRAYKQVRCFLLRQGT
jgi:hypothetical protein